MSSVATLIETMERSGVHLSLDDGQLIVSGIRDTVTEYLDTIRTHKPALMGALAADTATRAWLVHKPNGEVSEVFCTPPATAAQMAMDWPGSACAPMPAAPAIADTVTDGTDRRRCLDCTQLMSDGACLAAQRGELMHASRHYRPEQKDLRRCIAYSPSPADPDQSLGADRWPGLRGSKA